VRGVAPRERNRKDDLISVGRMSARAALVAAVGAASLLAGAGSSAVGRVAASVPPAAAGGLRGDLPARPRAWVNHG
jgi:hypothetical protein